MKKLIPISLVAVFLFAALIPFASASYVCPAAYNGGHSYSTTIQSVWPGLTAESAYGEVFTANATCYLYNMTFSLAKGGSPGFMKAFLMEAAGTPGTDGYPTIAIYASSTARDANGFPGSASDQTFYFDGTFEMQSGTKYAAVVVAYNGTWSGAGYVRVYRATIDAVAGMNAVKYESSAWSASATAETYFIINGDTESELPTPTPTPTPTASPTPAGYTPTPAPNDISTVIDAVMANINVLIFLAIIFIFGVLGYGFAGAWGFFAGVNLAVIMLVLFGTLPLWTAIALIVLDGLMFFGKAEIGKGNKKED